MKTKKAVLSPNFTSSESSRREVSGMVRLACGGPQAEGCCQSFIKFGFVADEQILVPIVTSDSVSRYRIADPAVNVQARTSIATIALVVP